MAEINHKIGIKADAATIYAALTNNTELAKWWTTDTQGAGEVGSVIEFRFGGKGPDFKVSQLETNKLVVWKCVGGMPDAWLGTEVSFHLENADKQTIIRFRHLDWKENSDFLAHCTTKWAVFLLSLKDLIEKGQGKPYPNDTQIDHY